MNVSNFQDFEKCQLRGVQAEEVFGAKERTGFEAVQEEQSEFALLMGS